jgi:hypothetical protein
MAVYANEGRWDASNTEVRRDAEGELWVARYEKGSTDPELRYIDYGAMALRRAIIAPLPADTPSGLDAIQHELARTGRLRAHLARDRFFEIGSEIGLADFERAIAARGGTPP